MPQQSEFHARLPADDAPEPRRVPDRAFGITVAVVRSTRSGC